MTARYLPIGRTLAVSVSVERMLLSDKIALLRFLLEDLGVDTALYRGLESEELDRVNKVLDEHINGIQTYEKEQ